MKAILTVAGPETDLASQTGVGRKSVRAICILAAIVFLGISAVLSFAITLAAPPISEVTTSLSVSGLPSGVSPLSVPVGGCNGNWSVVSSPSPGGGDHTLYAADAASASDVWTVGSYSAQPSSPRLTLIEHWDGTAWSVVSSPSPGNTGNSLQGVAVAASNDVWAVGQYYQSDQVRHPLILHWNGSIWSMVASPVADGGLRDVTVISQNDVWAVGTGPLTIHWNGSTWSAISSPNPAFDILNEVSGTASNDVWAVGYEINQAQTATTTFIIHWNGSAWSVVPSPNTSSVDNYLSGVTAISANDAWAVGYRCCDSGQPLAMHWDGSVWTIVTFPTQGNATLYDVTALASNDVWAVGTGDTEGVSEARSYHWDGAQWTLVPSEPAGNDYINFEGITAIATQDVWAVGEYTNPGNSHIYTLTEHYTGACPTPTSTRPTATSTATSTATATPVCGLGWNVAGSPNAGPAHNVLTGVVAVSANNIWASGYYTDISTGIARTLLEHWDGVQWVVVSSPNASALNNYLYGVDAISATDIWAVGLYTTVSGTQTLAIHWNGTAWTVVSSPNPPGDAELRAVNAFASNNVWAVGSVGPTNNRTLTMHWDGTTWSLVGSPNNGARENYLFAVKVLADNSVWAVGYYYDTTFGWNQMLTLRWDGSTWSVVPSPGYTDGRLYGIDGTSPSDFWVVGRRYDFAGRSEVVALHWDGSQWGGPPISGPGTATNVLYGVSALSSTDVWAVGLAQSSGGVGAQRTLTEHWNGTAWTLVESQNAGAYTNQLLAVASVGANDSWAVGSYRPNTSSFETSLVLHYSDPCITPTPVGSVTSTPTSTWVTTSTPTVAATTNTAIASATVTTTRTRTPTSVPTQTAGGPSATPVPTNSSTSTATDTPIPTSTVAPTQTAGGPSATTAPTQTTDPTATGTVAPPTNTAAVSTPTACSLQYTDVPPENTFYPFVRCLACRGIISGYQCGGEGEPCDPANNPYFRPNVNVTRGQIAKIVSNSAGYDEDPNPSIYEDVNPTNTFYQWINRLSRRGHMGGYPCGTVPEEPCILPENRPYFRPFANATRGQLAKIVSNAAGFSDTPVEQIFADVLPENGFYVWIERLASRGIMGGYSCGGEGESCDEQQRPYFRPYNNVTRGQTSKIVSGAFFPDCQTRARP